MTRHHILRTTLALVTGICVLSSCSKNWVDTLPNGSPAVSIYGSTDFDLQNAATAMYAAFANESTWGRDLFWTQNAGDDLVVGRSNGNAVNIKNFVPSGREGYLTAAWTDLYSMISRANNLIQLASKAKDASNSVKQQVLGEAYFIRGFAHFWLAYLWGTDKQGVPFDGPENAEYGNRIPPQLPSVKDNYAQIVKDLQNAANLLPLFSTYTSDNYGKAHKCAAWGYIAKVYAYWAQYDKSKWALAANYCDSVSMKGERKLLVDPKGGLASYQSVFKIENNWSSEYIWSVNSGVQGGSEFPGVVLENKGWGIYNGWGYFQPTEELYEEYEKGDPRRACTILSFGDSFVYFGEKRAYSSTNSLTGFQINKYMEPYSYGMNGKSNTNLMINQSGDNPTTRLNLPLMRYAEILLFKAEALINMGRSAEAAIPLNEVRARVGLSPISSPTMADLKHERRCELACEWTDRFEDLKRWGDFAQINAALHGRIHANQSDPQSPYTIQEVWPARQFVAPKDMAWPINPDEILKSEGAYKQNEGW